MKKQKIMTARCQRCNGTGKVDIYAKIGERCKLPCPCCEGSGTINIPAVPERSCRMKETVLTIKQNKTTAGCEFKEIAGKGFFKKDGTLFMRVTDEHDIKSGAISLSSGNLCEFFGSEQVFPVSRVEINYSLESEEL